MLREDDIVIDAISALDRAELAESARRQVHDHLIRKGWTPPGDDVDPTTPAG